MAEGRAYVPIADPKSTLPTPGSDTPPPLPPTGCFACKKRRIFCDRGLPACYKCAKKNIKCPGYQKPKIIWKVLKTNQVPESRKITTHKNDIGKSEPLPSSRKNGTETAVRARFNTLLDVGYTFKLESPTEQKQQKQQKQPQQEQQQQQQQLIESIPQTTKVRESPPSGEEEIETIPRQNDPYLGNFDHLSRDTLDYYRARICLCLEYFKPLRPGPTGLLAPSSTNPLTTLMAEGVSSPLLLNCMLSVAARHRVIIIKTEQYNASQREQDARAMYTSSLTYRGRAVRLLMERLDNTPTGRRGNNTSMGVTGLQAGKVRPPETKELWEDNSVLMVILLLLYFETVDGGQGEGTWRTHLEVGKWVIEQREARGLGMGTPGVDWGFIKDHLEVFDAIGSSFTVAWRIPPQDLWLRRWPGEQPIYDALLYPLTPTGAPDDRTMHPQRLVHDIVHTPDRVPDYPLLLIPRALWWCMHQIATLRREYALLKTGSGTCLSLPQICNAHEHVLACVSAFDPSLWPAPPIPEMASPKELVVIGSLYQLSLHVYLHLSLTIPLSEPIEAPASSDISVNSQTIPNPRVGTSPLPTDPSQASSPISPEFPSKANTIEFMTILSSSLVARLPLISSESPSLRSTVWPCMCAGIAAQTVAQVVLAKRFMQLLCKEMPCLGVTRGFEALQRLWAKRAQAARARRARSGLSYAWDKPEGLAEEDWDDAWNGYEGGSEDWEAVVASFEGDWLVI